MPGSACQSRRRHLHVEQRRRALLLGTTALRVPELTTRAERIAAASRASSESGLLRETARRLFYEARRRSTGGRLQRWEHAEHRATSSRSTIPNRGEMRARRQSGHGAHTGNFARSEKERRCDGRRSTVNLLG